MDKKIKIRHEVKTVKVPVTYIGENYEDESRKQLHILQTLKTR